MISKPGFDKRGSPNLNLKPPFAFLKPITEFFPRWGFLGGWSSHFRSRNPGAPASPYEVAKPTYETLGAETVTSSAALREPGLGFAVSGLGFVVLGLVFVVLGLGCYRQCRVAGSRVGLRGFGVGFRDFGVGLRGFGFGLRGFGSGLRKCNGVVTTFRKQNW